MLSHFPKYVKRTVWLLIVAALFLGLYSIPLTAKTCEDAFILCWNEMFWTASFGAAYCTLGYFFCKKYIGA
ncbi:MAG: hypothetical protein ACE5L7_05435 [Candidatus Aminicenantales bacterium]